MRITPSAISMTSLPVLQGLIGISNPPFDPVDLFSSGEEGVLYDPSQISTLFQDSAGTTPVTAVGQPVGRVLDISGNGNHLAQTTSTARPTLKVDATSGAYYLSDDGDDALTVSMPDLGTDATVVYAAENGLRFLEGQTIGSGNVDIPLNTTAVLYIDRALTTAEKADITAWFD